MRGRGEWGVDRNDERGDRKEGNRNGERGTGMKREGIGMEHKEK